MRTFRGTSQFKKDWKRQKKRGLDLAKLHVVMRLLVAGDELPARYLDHPLRGEYANARDCHIEPDWILIYALKNDETHV